MVYRFTMFPFGNSFCRVYEGGIFNYGRSNLHMGSENALRRKACPPVLQCIHPLPSLDKVLRDVTVSPCTFLQAFGRWGHEPKFEITQRSLSFPVITIILIIYLFPFESIHFLNPSERKCAYSIFVAIFQWPCALWYNNLSWQSKERLWRYF